MKSYEKIASILRTDKDNIRKIEERFSEVTGKKYIMDKIIEDNEFMVKSHLERLGLTREASAGKIYNALIRHIESDSTFKKSAAEEYFKIIELWKYRGND